MRITLFCLKCPSILYLRAWRCTNARTISFFFYILGLCSYLTCRTSLTFFQLCDLTQCNLLKLLWAHKEQILMGFKPTHSVCVGKHWISAYCPRVKGELPSHPSILVCKMVIHNNKTVVKWLFYPSFSVSTFFHTHPMFSLFCCAWWSQSSS